MKYETMFPGSKACLGGHFERFAAVKGSKLVVGIAKV